MIQAYYCFLGESSIGRDENCDLSIDSEALSRVHAILLVEQGVHFIKDNKSVNKTFRNSVSFVIQYISMMKDD